MSVTLKQYKGSPVTPTDDAVLYNFLDTRSGVIEGCTVAPDSTGTAAVVATGWGVIKGRVFRCLGDNVTLDDPTNKKYLILKMDISPSSTQTTPATICWANQSEIDSINAAAASQTTSEVETFCFKFGEVQLDTELKMVGFTYNQDAYLTPGGGKNNVIEKVCVGDIDLTPDTEKRVTIAVDDTATATAYSALNPLATVASILLEKTYEINQVSGTDPVSVQIEPNTTTIFTTALNSLSIELLLTGALVNYEKEYRILFKAGSISALTYTVPANYVVEGLADISFTSGNIYEISFVDLGLSLDETNQVIGAVYKE